MNFTVRMEKGRKVGEVGMTNQEAIRILDEQRNKFMDEWVDFGCVNEAYNMAISLLKKVVRCKDCKNNNQCSIQFKFADADNPGDWFCADGKRADS